MTLNIIDEGQGPGVPGACHTVIKVVGAGGGGNNAINRMIDANLKDVQFIALNTDLQALGNSRAHIRESLGTQTTRGLGAGGNPEVGERAAMEDKDKIKKLLDGSDMVFVTAGMGGGTGTGAAPVVAQICREMGILCVAVVTKPFDFEGERKKLIAEEGIRKLHDSVDSLITIPNQYLVKISDKRTSVKESFRMADDVLRQGVQGISDLITRPGEMNIDFADVKAIMEGRGDAIMGIGSGEGDNRAVDAATDAIHNPLLQEANIEGATGVLVNVLCSSDFPIGEYEEIMRIITANADADAQIKAGIVYDETMGDRVQVTVIATGFCGGRAETGAHKPGAAVYGKDGLSEVLGQAKGGFSLFGGNREKSAPQSKPAAGPSTQAYSFGATPASSSYGSGNTGRASASAQPSNRDVPQNLEIPKRDGPLSFDDIAGTDLAVPAFFRTRAQQGQGK